MLNCNAQPALLNLFDTHYLPLQARLRPIMSSFILALLPGLEEETGEFFDKVRNYSRLFDSQFLMNRMWAP